jgi:hypothetical protein
VYGEEIVWSVLIWYEGKKTFTISKKLRASFQEWEGLFDVIDPSLRKSE